MRIKANDITFNCKVEGKAGAPWVVFSNGLATNFSMWDQQVEVLKGSHQVLCYDQRGHGRTEAPTGPYSFDTLIADAVGLFDALDIKKAHWVGLSIGSDTGLGMAQHHPDRVDRLVVCGSACASSPASAQQWEELIALAKKGGMEALVERLVERWFANPATAAAYVDKIRQIIRVTPANGFIGCAAALVAYDFRMALSHLKRPVMLIVGNQDAHNAAAMRALRKALPNTRLTELTGASHLCNIDQPKTFNRSITDFLG
jgi:3-oxoadipate enol-lactonase